MTQTKTASPLKPFHLALPTLISTIAVSQKTLPAAIAQMQFAGQMIQTAKLPQDVAQVESAFEQKLGEIAKFERTIENEQWVTDTYAAIDQQKLAITNGAGDHQVQTDTSKQTGAHAS